MNKIKIYPIILGVVEQNPGQPKLIDFLSPAPDLEFGVERQDDGSIVLIRKRTDAQVVSLDDFLEAKEWFLRLPDKPPDGDYRRVFQIGRELLTLQKMFEPIPPSSTGKPRF